MRGMILSFAIWPLVHLITQPLTSFLHLKCQPKVPIFLGLLILTLSMWLIGRVNVFGVQADTRTWTSIQGLILQGFASGLMQPSINYEAKACVIFTARTSQINNQITLDYFLQTFLAGVSQFGMFSGLLLSSELNERFGTDCSYGILIKGLLVLTLIYFLS